MAWKLNGRRFLVILWTLVKSMILYIYFWTLVCWTSLSSYDLLYYYSLKQSTSSKNHQQQQQRVQQQVVDTAVSVIQQPSSVQATPPQPPPLITLQSQNNPSVASVSG